jgi:hypothetical protein
MTDQRLKITFRSIVNGFITLRNNRVNYTNEHWYNFKSYIYGTNISHTICSDCNNFKPTCNENNGYSDRLSITQIMCDCAIFGYQNKLSKGNLDISPNTCVFDDDFVDIINDEYDYPYNDLKRSVVF